MSITPEFIESNWPLTDVVIKEMPRQGNGGSVGIVESKEGRYVYKIPGSWKKADALERDLGVYDFLNAKDFQHIPKLLKTKNAKDFVNAGDTLVFLMEFVEGEAPVPNPETYTEIAKVLAKLHSIKDFPFVSDYKPADAIPELIVGAEKFAFKDEYSAILKTIRDFSHLPLVPMHTEMTPQNCVLKPDGTLIAIDWDEAGLGPAVLDLGVALINHFVTEDLEILDENAHAYYQTYFSLRNMPEAEREYLFDAGLFWACAWVGYGDTEKRWKRLQWAMANKDVVNALWK